MKVFHVILLFAVAALFGGCSMTEQTTDDVGRQFQDGLSGRGRIVSDRVSSDSFGSDYR